MNFGRVGGAWVRVADILDRAYQICFGGGGANGDALDAWLKAELELDAEMGKFTPGLIVLI
jgi:hypothetical protein